MGWTKRDFINQAFEEVGLASYVFDLTADQLQSAKRKLDSMMGTWAGKRINVGFPISDTATGGDLDQVTNVPDYAREAIYLNLGLRLAPSFGKAVTPELKASARLAYNTLLARDAAPPEMQMPRDTPAGAGHKSWDTGPFLDSPDTNPLKNADNGQLIFSE